MADSTRPQFPRWLILTALPLEAAALGPSLPGSDLRIIGPAAKRLPTDLSSQNLLGICMAGLGGGLDPTLRIGDIVVDGPAPLPVDHHPFSISAGGIYTAPQIISTPAAKAALWQSTGARAVDMETDAARRLAQTLNVPFLAVRAISDTAAESLDPEMARIIDSRGRIRPATVAKTLLRCPSRLKDMLRLGRNSKLALRNLAVILPELLLAAQRLSPSPERA